MPDCSSTKDLFYILQAEILLNLCNKEKIRISELNALIAFLIKNNIDFDLEFRSKTFRQEREAILQIYINCKVAINLTFRFDNC